MNVNSLYVDGWSPGAVNGASNGGWGKRDDNKETAGPDICWDLEGSVNPIAMQEMTEEERDVHSPLATLLCKVMVADEEPRHSLHLSIRH